MTQLHDFLTHLMRGGKHGFWWTDDKRRSLWWPTSNIPSAPGEPKNWWFGVHPVSQIPPTNSRGEEKPQSAVRSQIEYIAAVNCLYADVDGKQLENKEAALAHVEAMEPAPSVIIDSGGGYHCYWLLDEPFLLDDDDDRDHAQDVQARWVEFVGADKGAKDLARVLRIPGTRNYKPKYKPDFPEVHFVKCDLTLLYKWLALAEAMPRPEPKPEPARAPALRTPQTHGTDDWTRAIETAQNMIDMAMDGEKHSELLKAARLLGGYVAGGFGDIGEARSALRMAIESKAGVEDLEQAYRTIEDGLNYGNGAPITPEQKEQERAAWRAANGKREAQQTHPPARKGNGADGAARPAQDKKKQELPKIKANARGLSDITQDALDALIAANDPPVLFVRSGAIARIVADEHGRPRIDNMNENALRGRIARVAFFYNTLKDGVEVPCAPPMNVVRDIMGLGQWSFPALQGIIETPALRPDGTLLKKPGYDKATALYYRPGDLDSIEIPDSPTKEDVEDAINLILGVIGEFPFADDASRVNSIGLLLTPIIRPAIGGCVPMAVIDAPQAGTGKTLLTSTVAVVATGREAALMTAARSGEEWRKKITTVLLDGATVILIDNASNLFADELASAVTSRLWRDRLLGKHESIVVPQRATWIANGNNVRLNGDLPRRCYWIRLDAKMSRPWQRGKFSYKLPDWARENRGKLIAAALTIARSWWDNGCPKAKAPVLGGFSEWTETISGILANAGVDGFLGNINLMYDQIDDETPQWEGFLLALSNAFDGPVAVSEICTRIETDSTLADILPDTLDAQFDSGGKITTRFKRQLGKAFSARNGKRYGDSQACLSKSEEKAGNGAVKWLFSHSSHSSHSSNHPTPHEGIGNEIINIGSTFSTMSTMSTMQDDDETAEMEF